MRSPGLGSEVVMPCLDEGSLIGLHHAFDVGKLSRPKPEVSRQTHGREPEFGGQIVSVYVYVGRLVGLMTVEVKPIGTDAEHRGHGHVVTGNVHKAESSLACRGSRVFTTLDAESLSPWLGVARRAREKRSRCRTRLQSIPA